MNNERMKDLLEIRRKAMLLFQKPATVVQEGENALSVYLLVREGEEEGTDEAMAIQLAEALAADELGDEYDVAVYKATVRNLPRQ